MIMFIISASLYSFLLTYIDIVETLLNAKVIYTNRRHKIVTAKEQCGMSGRILCKLPKYSISMLASFFILYELRDTYVAT